MSVSDSVLRNYATHGNDLSLAILIYAIRQHFILYWSPYWPRDSFWKVLLAASKFDALNTSSELQHEFCALWNQVVRRATGVSTAVRWNILRPIRNVYLTLHLHTDCAPTEFSASTSDNHDRLWHIFAYPLCNIDGHHPDSTPRIHDASTSTVIPRSHNAALVPSSPPVTPSPSITTPIHVDETPLGYPIVQQYASSCNLILRPSDHHGKRPQLCCFTRSNCRWRSTRPPLFSNNVSHRP